MIHNECGDGAGARRVAKSTWADGLAEGVGLRRTLTAVYSDRLISGDGALHDSPDHQAEDACNWARRAAARRVKRAFDLAAALSALIILAPLLGLTAVLIRLDSPGPVLFKQTRNGLGNRPFKIFKFRTMTVTEDGAEFKQAVKDDPRITRVGAFLRKSSLDELPQFLNVLKGEMSIVGPRPHPVLLNDAFRDEIQGFDDRAKMKPGLTGLAQIHGFRGPTPGIEQMAPRVERDLQYVETWSLLLDLQIVLKTAAVILNPRNAF